MPSKRWGCGSGPRRRRLIRGTTAIASPTARQHAAHGRSTRERLRFSYLPRAATDHRYRRPRHPVASLSSRNASLRSAMYINSPLPVRLVIPASLLPVAGLADALVAIRLRTVPGELLDPQRFPAFGARSQHHQRRGRNSGRDLLTARVTQAFASKKPGPDRPCSCGLWAWPVEADGSCLPVDVRDGFVEAGLFRWAMPSASPGL